MDISQDLNFKPESTYSLKSEHFFIKCSENIQNRNGEHLFNKPCSEEIVEKSKKVSPVIFQPCSSSSNESSLNFKIEFDGTTVLCRVCGDKASGFHYGVHSCEGCKGFFRRSIQQKIQYRPCTKNQQCSILRINRNRCQYCRLKKCIAVGMSRDAVRFGRVPKREKARILAAMTQCTQSKGQEKMLSNELDDQPKLIASVLDAHTRTCEFTREKVSSMRQKAKDCPSYSLPTLACPLNPVPELQSEQEFSQRFAHIIRGVIDFAGLIPGFQLLTQDDKFTLLKAGLFDALFVRLICMFDTQMNSIICLNGQIMPRDAIQNGANARFLVDSTFNFAERINSMHLNDTEIALFCAIVLITPDRPGLRNVELVETMYTKLKQCLELVVSKNRPEKPEFMRNLLSLLPDLRTLSTLHTEKLVVFRTEHKELLRQQMCSEDKETHKPQSTNSLCNNLSAKEPDTCSIMLTSNSCEQQAASTHPSYTDEFSKTWPFRHRASSSSSVDEDFTSTTHLVQNGLTITPVSRSSLSIPISNKYRKLDSPTDSGIESGNEKLDLRHCTGSSSSSPRNSIEEVNEDKRQTYEDMPVLKRVLQAPPLYDTNSLMNEAYKPHKKFRAMRQRDSETESYAMKSRVSSNDSVQSSRSHLQVHSARSMLQQQQVPLSTTYSLLAKSLKEEPRMTAEQLKRTDIIQNYIMRDNLSDKFIPKNEISIVNGLSVTVGRCPDSSSNLNQSKSNENYVNKSITSSDRSENTTRDKNSYCTTSSMVEVQIGIADHQPLNLSKKSPSPSPSRFVNARHIVLEA